MLLRYARIRLDEMGAATASMRDYRLSDVTSSVCTKTYIAADSSPSRLSALLANRRGAGKAVRFQRHAFFTAAQPGFRYVRQRTDSAGHCL